MTTTATDNEAAFRAEFARFGEISRSSARFFEMDWADRLPCRDDRTAGTAFDRHYIYHTAWAARVLARLRPGLHVDIASSLYFAAIASAFVPTRYYEYRPVDLHLPNLACDRADLTRLPFADRSIDSLSCMHVVEHVGLGRYGDALDPEGDLRAMSELCRVLAPGGSLLFVVPVGRPRVQFNAHRIYAFEQVRQAFDGLELVEFALVPDRAYAEAHAESTGAALIANATKEQSDAQRYGCGCFWFRRGA
jgi:SAM-dependent methyltransferase